MSSWATISDTIYASQQFRRFMDLPRHAFYAGCR